MSDAVDIDPMVSVASDIRAAFKRIEALSANDNGLFNSACVTAVSVELAADSADAASFDVCA
jgi:hypothetical protein